MKASSLRTVYVSSGIYFTMLNRVKIAVVRIVITAVGMTSS